MDNNPQDAKPISDDPELAKVLAGVSQQTDQALQFDSPQADPVTPTDTPSDGAQPAMTTPLDEDAQTPAETTAEPQAEAEQAPATEPADANPYTADPLPEPVAPTPEVTPEPVVTPVVTPPSESGDLTSIKKDALNDLRPLVGKLDIAPEEKFDTYLLLIRSTDDKTLIEPAYAAAQAITDESRKAQALLDVIKEIDYLSNPAQ